MCLSETGDLTRRGRPFGRWIDRVEEYMSGGIGRGGRLR